MRTDYLTTGSKSHLTPLSPKKEQIKIEDIAHALSFMTRANGQFPEFYSVGQHSIHCMEEAQARGYSKRVQLACLLHDGSEAYMADIIRPIKKHLPGYLEIEAGLQGTIYEKYLDTPLTEEEMAQVKSVDDNLLYHEFYHYMGEALFEEEPVLKSNPAFITEEFKTVEKRFLEKFHTLQAKIEI